MQLRAAWLAVLLFCTLLFCGIVPSAYAVEPDADQQATSFIDVSVNAGVSDDGAAKRSNGASDLAVIGDGRPSSNLNDPVETAEPPKTDDALDSNDHATASDTNVGTNDESANAADVSQPDAKPAKTETEAGEEPRSGATQVNSPDDAKDGLQNKSEQNTGECDKSYWSPSTWSDSVWLSGKRSFTKENGKWVFSWELKDSLGYIRYVRWNAIFTPACLQGEFEAAKLAALDEPSTDAHDRKSATDEEDETEAEVTAVETPRDEVYAAEPSLSDKGDDETRNAPSNKLRLRAPAADIDDNERLSTSATASVWQLAAEASAASKQATFDAQNEGAAEPATEIARDPHRALSSTGFPGFPAAPVAGAIASQRDSYTEPTQTHAILVEETPEQTFKPVSDVSHITQANCPYLIRGTLSCRAP